MNRDWRRKDKATDVLSFPQYGVAELKALAHAGGLDGDFWSVGDIVISLERAEAQAREKGISLRRELEVLFIHGFLHLLGYDHEGSEREAQRMHRLERKLLGP